MKRVTFYHEKLITFLQECGYRVSSGGICSGISGVTIEQFFQYGHLVRFNEEISDICREPSPVSAKAYLTGIFSWQAKRAALHYALHQNKKASLSTTIAQQEATHLLSLCEKITLFQCSDKRNALIVGKAIPQCSLEQLMQFTFPEENADQDERILKRNPWLNKSALWTNDYTKDELFSLFSLLNDLLVRYPLDMAIAMGGPLLQGLHAVTLCYNSTSKVWYFTDINQPNPDITVTKTILPADVSSIVDFITKAYNEGAMLPLYNMVFTLNKDKILADQFINALYQSSIFINLQRYTPDKIAYKDTKSTFRLVSLAAICGDINAIRSVVTVASKHQLNLQSILGYLAITAQATSLSEEQSITPLMIAAQYGHVEIMKFLIEQGMDVNQESAIKHTAIHHAIVGNQPASIELLALNGVNLDQADSDGYTALHVASMDNDKKDCIKCLIKFNAKVNVANKNGETPLHLAARNGDLNAMKYLIKYGAKMNLTNKDEDTLLHLACGWGHVDCVKYLLEHQVDINRKNKCSRTPLQVAVVRGRLECVKYLIEQGANAAVVDDMGNTLIHDAITYGYPAVLEYLKPNQRDKKQVNQKGNTPLHVAIKGGHGMDYVRLLVGDEAQVNQVNHKGMTALHLAAKRKYSEEIIKFLIKQGANINQIDKEGHTPLFYADAKGLSDNIKLLQAKNTAIRPRFGS